MSENDRPLVYFFSRERAGNARGDDARPCARLLLLRVLVAVVFATFAMGWVVSSSSFFLN